MNEMMPQGAPQKKVAQIPGIPEQNPNAYTPKELRKGIEGLQAPIKKGERMAVDAEGLAKLQKLTEFAGSKFGNEEAVSKQISESSRALQATAKEIDTLKRERQAIMDRSLRSLKAEDKARLDQISGELAMKRYQALEGRSHRLELLKQRADFGIDEQHQTEYLTEKADADARAKQGENEAMKEDEETAEFMRDVISRMMKK